MGYKVGKDPQDFADDMEKIFRVIHASDTEEVMFFIYQLKGVSYQWYDKWGELWDKNIEHAV